MKLEVVALAPTDWEAWVANQQTLPPSPTDPLAKQGEELFLNPLSDGRGQCTACHAVGDSPGGAAAPEPDALRRPRPTRASRGATGPPRTVRRSRPGSRTPTRSKLGAKMPDYGLTPEEIDALVAYLYSLT